MINLGSMSMYLKSFTPERHRDDEVGDGTARLVRSSDALLRRVQGSPAELEGETGQQARLGRPDCYGAREIVPAVGGRRAVPQLRGEVDHRLMKRGAAGVNCLIREFDVKAGQRDGTRRKILSPLYPIKLSVIPHMAEMPFTEKSFKSASTLSLLFVNPQRCGMLAKLDAIVSIVPLAANIASNL